MRIVLTGGGTAGHVVPNVAVIEGIRSWHHDAELLYLGSRNGPEKRMMSEIGVDFRAIQCGKLRRYFSLQNFSDLLKLPLGIFMARRILKDFGPEKIFSKGGYVSFPVVIAGWSLRIPVIMHESDYSPGLANRISAMFASTVCVSFEESKKFFKGRKVVVTGNPVRKMIFNGSRERGLQLTGFNDEKPIVLVMGGSMGAGELNDLVFDNLPELLKYCQVAHVTGKGKGGIESVRDKLKDYKQFEYLNEELADIYAACNMIVSRAGANSLAEISALGIPSVLVPLSIAASRGDQIENAIIFEKERKGVHFKEGEDFVEVVISALKNRKQFKRTANDAVEKILPLLR